MIRLLLRKDDTCRSSLRIIERQPENKQFQKQEETNRTANAARMNTKGRTAQNEEKEKEKEKQKPKKQKREKTEKEMKKAKRTKKEHKRAKAKNEIEREQTNKLKMSTRKA